MPDIDEVLTNPRFKNLSIDKQKKALSLVSERFRNLDDAKQERFITLHPSLNRPVTTYEEIKSRLPDDPGFHEKAKEVAAIAATTDTPEISAITTRKELEEQGLIEKENVFTQAGKNIMAGLGDLSRLTGGLINRLNFIDDKPDFVGTWLENEGKRLQQTYQTKYQSDGFQFRDLLDPEWYANSIPRSLPMSLSLIPLALMGRSIGLAAIAKVTQSLFWRYVGGSLGAGAFNRAGESALEAEASYQQAISEGQDESEANKRFNDVFRNNMFVGTGLDAAEFLAAFTPFKFRPSTRIMRLSGLGMRLSTVASLGGVEERVQEFIQSKAENPDLPYSAFFDNEFDEPTAIGAIYGLGLGGSGSVLNMLKSEVEAHITEPELKEQYESDKKSVGQDEALEKLVESEEGRKVVDNAVRTLKNKAEGKEVTPAETQKVQQKEVEEPITEQDIEQFADEIIQEPEPEPEKGTGEVSIFAKRRNLEPLIRESKALRAALKKSATAARKAFTQGKREATEKERAKIVRIMNRQRKLRAVRDEFGLTDNDMKKITRKNPLIMSQYEYKQFLDDVRLKAEELADKKQARAELQELITRKQLRNTENFRRAIKLPVISKMNADQLRIFAEMLEPFREGDAFLSQRRLEEIDKVESLRGAKTWNDVRDRMAKDLNMPEGSFDNLRISTTWTDKFRFDNALMEQNPFYELMVEETTRQMLDAELKYTNFENEIFELANKANKSKKRKFLDIIIPTDEKLVDYLESENPEQIANDLTKEELALANKAEDYLSKALEHLVRTEALQKGIEDYFPHIRRHFLETVKDDGLRQAFDEMMTQYDQDRAMFEILEGATGEILPYRKFFRHTLHRSGELIPSKNFVKVILNYAKAFERKKALDEILLKFDLYAQALTPELKTPLGLEMDRSLKRFVKEYMNNKKGRWIDLGIVQQGSPPDVALRTIKTFTTLMDLGINIPVGVASIGGEASANWITLGTKKAATGWARMHSKKGKQIIEKYKGFVGRSAWEEFTEPGKVFTERLSVGMFGLFHNATVKANAQFLLGSMTKDEYNAGEISLERLTDIRLEMGRFRVVPGTRSLAGSTIFGKLFTQYRSWAIPLLRQTIKDIEVFSRNLRAGEVGKAFTSKEARELTRIVSLIAVIGGTGALLLADDDRDRGFVDEVLTKVFRELLSVLQSFSPSMWGRTSRVSGFLQELGKNLEALVRLEEYKTTGELKGVKGLQRQFTPRAVKQFIPEEKKVKR